jgi:hypothetical protein
LIAVGAWVAGSQPKKPSKETPNAIAMAARTRETEAANIGEQSKARETPRKLLGIQTLQLIARHFARRCQAMIRPAKPGQKNTRRNDRRVCL